MVVLDGVLVEIDFFDILSENIESVNVLKGMVVLVLYGLCGKNGVILIISKMVKKEGLEINFFINNMIIVGFVVFFEI